MSGRHFVGLRDSQSHLRRTMEPLTVFSLFLLFALGIRLVAGSMDGERIERDLLSKDLKLTSCSWSPFAPGWFGRSGSRGYKIDYRDQDGARYTAFVSTSMLGGVYIRDERRLMGSPTTIKASREASKERDLQAVVSGRMAADLERENARLRARIRELEGE